MRQHIFLYKYMREPGRGLLYPDSDNHDDMRNPSSFLGKTISRGVRFGLGNEWDYSFLRLYYAE